MCSSCYMNKNIDIRLLSHVYKKYVTMELNLQWEWCSRTQRLSNNICRCMQLCRRFASRVLKDFDMFEVWRFFSNHYCTINERGGYQNKATAGVISKLLKRKFSGVGGGPRPREIRRMMCGDITWVYFTGKVVDNGQGSCNAS